MKRHIPVFCKLVLGKVCCIGARVMGKVGFVEGWGAI
jgi:hypothetical protein